MDIIYEKNYHLSAVDMDCYNRLRCSRILSILQEVAGDHSALLDVSRGYLMEQDLFWAVIRHRICITRLPRSGENITVKTWPMPTTRTAYPRAAVAYDEQGQELFRSISLWVLMDFRTRAMVLPGKSGVLVEGHTEGIEPAAPGSLAPRMLESSEHRGVKFTDLDVNGHMNNCRYLDWVADLLPSSFHKENHPAEITLCYLSEAKEGEELTLSWEMADGALRVEAQRGGDAVSAGHSRVFAAQVRF